MALDRDVPLAFNTEWMHSEDRRSRIIKGSITPTWLASKVWLTACSMLIALDSTRI